MATYTYSNVRPGTYLYQSGTLPHIQVPMGLYGMLRKNAPQTTTAARVAYPGAASAPDQYAFDNEIALLLSEVDPAQNGAVAAGTFTSSAIGYDPKFFRVHRYAMPTDPAVSVISQPVEFTDGPARGALSVTLGTRQLVRVVNAGIQSRALTLIDGHWHLIAEDGNVFPYPREQYSAFLPAAKSADLWFTPTLATGAALDRRMAIFDRRFALTNNDGNSVGGMLVRLNIAGTGTAPTLDVAGCPATGTQGTPYTCTAVATGSGAPLYSLDIAPVGMTIDAATGQIAWTPNNDQAYKPLLGQTASNPVQVRATDPSGRYATANFSVAVSNVDDAPVARDDAYDVRGGALTVGPARSVLVNDSDPDGDPITAVTLVAAPTNGTLTLNADGTFTYTAATLPTSGATTTTFTYKVTANGVDSAPATVTLTLYANSAPTAVDDVDARSFAAVGPSYLDVLANDYDVDGNLDVNTLAIVGAPNRGGTAAVATTGCPVATRPCIAYTPAPTFRGTEAITYRVSDTLGAASNVATARINVQ
jgi:VCBS repeat-containing protein